jgi:hypothetical protein
MMVVPIVAVRMMVVAIIVMMVMVVAIVMMVIVAVPCCGWSSAADGDYANYTHCCSDLP